MFTVTESALEFLANAVGEINEPKPANACFRIVRTAVNSRSPLVHQSQTTRNTNEKV